MGVSEEYRQFVEDLFADLGPVSVRAMFGGAGIYHQGVMFAIIANESLYLKVDDGNRARLEAAGMAPFTYTAKGKTATMSYWELPEALYDDPDAAAEWAREAFAAALRSRKGGKSQE